MQIFVVVAVGYLMGVPAVAQMSDEAVYQKALNATFTIKTNRGSIGSAFVFQNGTMLVTNYHVIAGATSAVAIPGNNSQVEYVIAGVIAADVKLDVAVLKILGTFRTPLAPAATEPRIAQKIYAIGSPRGYEATFTSGMISGLRSTGIQHSAPMSPGSSGGALLNTNCEVVGMNTKQVTDGQNLNFAVPVSTILSVLENQHQLVSLTEINQIYGISIKEQTQAQQSQNTSSGISNTGLYMEFGGNNPHQAVMFSYEGTIQTYVRYYNKNSQQIVTIVEGCTINTDDTNKEWTRIDCKSPIDIKTKQPSSYLSDTFWIHKTTNKLKTQ